MKTVNANNGYNSVTNKNRRDSENFPIVYGTWQYISMLPTFINWIGTERMTANIKDIQVEGKKKKKKSTKKHSYAEWWMLA